VIIASDELPGGGGAGGGAGPIAATQVKDIILGRRSDT
jgi:hypothetical protein